MLRLACDGCVVFVGYKLVIGHVKRLSKKYDLVQLPTTVIQPALQGSTADA